jgi:hypothetical protein
MVKILAIKRLRILSDIIFSLSHMHRQGGSSPERDSTGSQAIVGWLAEATAA